ncbi:hypothetical protein [Streptomyces rishiriensis]|uniref:hypothetical protein n=1 Tax=Streptomyces rishiriensis TaxID=68264 RepID=UPI000D597148|nr:hypothetical protein [Streptomyces rishiriensis]
MSRHEQMCPHCRGKQAGAGAGAGPAVVEEQVIVLPDQPTPIRVHQPGRPPFDCTLHPDGRLTWTRPSGEVLTNLFTLADMREQGWATAHIEFDPPRLVEDPQSEPAAEAVQEALIA